MNFPIPSKLKAQIHYLVGLTPLLEKTFPRFDRWRGYSSFMGSKSQVMPMATAMNAIKRPRSSPMASP
jgi:hypothetical protein